LIESDAQVQIDQGPLIESHRVASFYLANMHGDMVGSGGQGNVNHWSSVIKREYPKATRIPDIQPNACSLARHSPMRTDRQQMPYPFDQSGIRRTQLARRVDPEPRHQR